MRRLFTGQLRSMGKRRIRATIMKLVAAAMCFVVFAFGFSGQRTQVISPVATGVIPTTAAPVVTTIELPPSTTVAIIPIATPTTTTVVEPWVTMPTTTIKVVLASYEPLTELERLICDPKWEWDCEEAIAVATCESRMNPRAVSKPNTN